MSKRNLGIGAAIILVILAVLSIVTGVDLVEKWEAAQANSQSPPITAGSDVAPENSDVIADWYEIYFTNPTCPPAEERVGGLDELIADEIRQARTRVDVAAFDLDAEPIVQALIDLEQIGVPVRVVTDADNGDLSSIRRLRRNGISVVEDNRRGLMHNKFIVIDGRYLFLGSMNFTSNGVYCNNNNLVAIESPRLAANFSAEMDEMYDQRRFGPDSPVNTPNERLFIGGVEVETYFAPEKALAPIVARAIARAQQEILFMAFSFTDDLIGEALLGRAEGGATVRGVFETIGAETSFSYYPLMQALTLPNLRVRLDGNPQIMHHKVLIIDRTTVVFGSFNFTDSANRSNDESIVIVHDPAFAEIFVEEFETVWLEAAP